MLPAETMNITFFYPNMAAAGSSYMSVNLYQDYNALHSEHPVYTIRDAHGSNYECHRLLPEYGGSRILLNLSKYLSGLQCVT
jgi:hypothetical protein